MPISNFRPKFILLGLACSLLSGHAFAQPLDRTKLTQLVPFPKMQAGFSIGFNSNNAPPDDASALAEIATLEKLPQDDVKRLLREGQLYSQVKNETKSKEKKNQAIAILRKQSQEKPGSASALLELGTALNQNNELPEAETTLRQVVKIDPENAQGWSTLGVILASKAIHDLIPSNGTLQFSLDSTPSMDQIGANLLTFRPNEAAFASAQKNLEEARASHAKAMQLAPRDFQVNSDNAGFQLSATFVMALVQSLTANETAQLKDTLPAASQAVSSAFFSQTLFANLLTLAQLKPEDPSLQSMAGMGALFSYIMTEGGDIPLEGGLEEIPAEKAAPVKAAIAKLEAISKAGGKDAAAALESLGGLYFVTGNPAAIDRLKQALALEPNRNQAYELQVGILASHDRYAELATLVEKRLKTQDNARNHVLLAKAYDSLYRPADATAQIEMALKLKPKDVTANLAKTALLLRADDATKASAQLKAITSVPDDQKFDYVLLQGVVFALQGKFQEARADWEKVLAKNDQHDAAKEMLATLPAQ